MCEKFNVNAAETLSLFCFLLPYIIQVAVLFQKLWQPFFRAPKYELPFASERKINIPARTIKLTTSSLDLFISRLRLFITETCGKVGKVFGVNQMGL